DVAAAYEFALYIELRNGRPVGEFLDALPQFGRIEHVDALVVGSDVVENLHDLAGKTALREAGRPLHEQHHVAALHFAADVIVDRAHIKIPLLSGFKVRTASLPLDNMQAGYFHSVLAIGRSKSLMCRALSSLSANAGRLSAVG